MSIIRIAPVCNGKIYVVPRTSADGKNSLMDLPIAESVNHISTKSDKVVRKIKEKYNKHVTTSMPPRFSVQYKSPSHHGNTVYLYILPLQEEDKIQFHEGQFVSAEDITNHPKQYTPHLQMESELLGMAAELWNDFYL